jgi:hypothetical protein
MVRKTQPKLTASKPTGQIQLGLTDCNLIGLAVGLINEPAKTKVNRKIDPNESDQPMKYLN